MSQWDEIGTSGLDEFSGYVTEAYNAKLYWPACVSEYDRIWRGDPEITLARNVLQAYASRAALEFVLPERDEKPTDDDKSALDFANQCLEDVEGGASAWLSQCVARIPFYGFGWWETPPGVRSPVWRPPQDDPWRSNYDDGLIGFRRFAFRHYKSFYRWQFDDHKRLIAMEQQDPPYPVAVIPLARSLHIRFGDLDNPEGLATLEALWRLERIKYGLEVVFGIGAEHAAGYLNVVANKTLTTTDHAAIQKAARGILTAQEGNYAAWPQDVTGEVKDVPFAAGTTLFDAIRYYGILKLALISMQWVALGTMSPYGSYSSMSDASTFFISWFNAFLGGIVRQADEQIGKRLFDYPVNKAAFPGMTRRPVLHVPAVQKDIPLQELGQFLTAFSAIRPLGDDDLLAVRHKTEFLPDILPEQPAPVTEPKPDAAPENDADDSIDSDGAPEQDEFELSLENAASHKPVEITHPCPLCNATQALLYEGHNGLLVCAECNRTYDPEVE